MFLDLAVARLRGGTEPKLSNRRQPPGPPRPSWLLSRVVVRVEHAPALKTQFIVSRMLG